MIVSISKFIENLFFLWVVVFSVFGYYNPHLFMWTVNYIPLFLGIIMFGMGITLEIADFKRIVTIPRALGIGVCAQFIIMPLAAFAVSIIIGLPTMIAVGFILVGSCPGGTASNVITYLAKGDVALSVAMTTISTLLSPIMTPLLVYLYAGSWINVPVVPMFFSILQVIIIPVSLGILLRRLLKERISAAVRLLPAVSVLTIATIIAGITAANAQQLSRVGMVVVVAVMLHNGLGLILGYWLSMLTGFDEKTRRTIAIEVGMQNSGLAVSLAVVHFESVAALPGAIFSVWHNISGTAIAWYFKKK